MVSTLPQATTNNSVLRDTRLAPFAPGRSEVKELAARFRATLPYKGAEKLTDTEVMGLAVASLSLGLNPYLGEIWGLPGMGLMIGRAGWVKKLDENFTNRGITWWDQYRDILPADYERYGIPKNAKLARLCELRRRDQITAYITALTDLKKVFPELAYEQTIELVGLPPVVIGVGYIMADEIEPGQTVTKQGRNGTYQQSTGYMSWSERAEKRAFAQACKKTVSLPYSVFSAGDIIEGAVVDAEYLEPYEAPVVDDGPIIQEYRDAPVDSDKPMTPVADGEHWIKTKANRSAFWGWAKGTMSLSEADVHAALSVEHIEDFMGSKSDAMKLIQEYAAAMTAGQDGEVSGDDLFPGKAA